ncbi:MAG: hypothetical protein J6P89_00125 [Oscillospiraceae bacterium]|nr:hypothetical protein [Oscillospiraceae bacterium]
MFWDQFIKLCNDNHTRPNPVAKELGFSSGVVTKWKNGSLPQTDALMKISQHFKVSVDYLLYGENNSSEVSVQNNPDMILITDKNERLLIQSYRALHYARQIQFLSSLITEAEKEDNSH